MLTQVQFQGIKSLLDVTVDLEPLTVLVGPNGCGKSTILDQIERLCAMTRPAALGGNTFGPAAAVVEAWTRLRERTPAAPRTLWRGVSGEWRSVSLTVPWKANANWSANAEMVVGAPGERRVVINNQAPAKPDFDELLTTHYGWRAQRLALAPAVIVEASAVTLTELRPDGHGLPTVLKDMAPEHTEAYMAMQQDMRTVVSAFRGIRLGKGVRHDTEGGTPVTTLELDMVQGRFPASQVSDGTRLALALLTVVHHPDLPNLVLIDDIDHGLHLSAQFQIIEAIRRVMAVRPELQVICTTHSPMLLDSFKPEEVRVLNLDAAGHTVVKRLTDNPDFERYHAVLHTGELWASTGEDWVLHASQGK